jgi:hypothetical protein
VVVLDGFGLGEREVLGFVAFTLEQSLRTFGDGQRAALRIRERAA